MTPGTVFLATIVVTAPAYGLAAVISAEGTPETKKLFLAQLPLNDSDTGAISQANLVEGTTVVCLKNDNVAGKAYILGPANYLLGDIKDTAYGRAIYNVTDMAENQSAVFKVALGELLKGSGIDFINFIHGADRDATPGDTDIIDNNGNAGLHIGRYIAQLRGSPAAFIDVSNITNAIRMIASDMEQHLPLSVILAGRELHVKDIAITEEEAFGLQKQPLTIDQNIITYTDANAIPLYRLQQLEGAGADGKEELVVSFPDEEAHYCTTEPPILAKRRTSLDGQLSDASAQNIISIKSPAIRGLHQVNYDDGRDIAEQNDILQPYDFSLEEQNQTTAPTLDAAISDAAINKLIDTLFTGDYLDKLKEKLAELGLKVSSADKTLAAKIDKDGTEVKVPFEPGPTENPEYGLPKFLQLTDPVTGKVSTYFNTTSFISQEPDGSILICDGYGSEIRMSRGNIYISPALDLFLRPGRDLSAMVPRHQSYNAQGSTTINSVTGMYLRSVTDLKMAGATGGSGIVSVECDAITKDQSNGLMLRSTCGATLTGNDLYIGLNSGIGSTESGVTDITGTIVIDACAAGRISMRSGEQVVDSQSVVMLAASSALVISPVSIDLMTDTVYSHGSVQIINSKTPTTINVVRNGISTEISMLANENPNLLVAGAVIVGANLTCNKAAKFCEGLISNGIGSTSQFCGLVEYKYGDPFIPANIEQPEAPNGLGATTADMVISLSGTIYQDHYISFNSFAFPQTYDVSPTMRMPGMVWQSQTGDKGTVWKEPVMVSPDGTETMCYPGFKVWNTATISTRDYKESTLSEGYITNT